MVSLYVFPPSIQIRSVNFPLTFPLTLKINSNVEWGRGGTQQQLSWRTGALRQEEGIWVFGQADH